MAHLRHPPLALPAHKASERHGKATEAKKATVDKKEKQKLQLVIDEKKKTIKISDWPSSLAGKKKK